jgi:tetratricopeptide (TPR) repeat protein
MSRAFALAAALALAAPAAAEDTDWTGRTVRLREGVKLGSKFGGGLVRDGAALEKGRAFVVKSDDAGLLELAGQTGFIFKSEAELAPGLPAPKAGGPATNVVQRPWPAGTEVLPGKRPDRIAFGTRDAAGNWVPFPMSGIMPMEVREDPGDGWVRIHDGHREGWARKGDLVTERDAPAHWDAAVKADPEDAFARFMRAEGWLRKGKPDRAIEDYDVCIRLEPGEAAYRNGRAVAWAEKKDYDRAAADAAEAIRLDPLRAPARVKRGNAWAAMKEYDKAIDDYTGAIALDPYHALARVNRGVAWAAKGDYDRAIADYTGAIALDPGSAAALNDRGAAWFARGEYAKAIDDYTAAIRLEPRNALARNNRGLAWFARKDYRKAVADYAEAIRLDPKYAHAHVNRGNAWFAGGEYGRAIEDYTAAIRLAPHSALARINRALARVEVREYQKAVEDYTGALGLEPRNVSALGNRAVALARLKRYEDAARGFEAAMKIDATASVCREYALFLATCPDAKYRDGRRAVELARGALEKVGPGAGWKYHAALAAASAEAGDIEAAAAEQLRAAEDKSLSRGDREEMEKRLELYRAKRAYRDE